MRIAEKVVAATLIHHGDTLVGAILRNSDISPCKRSRNDHTLAIYIAAVIFQMADLIVLG